MRNFHSFVFPAAWVMAALALLWTASPAVGQDRAYEGIFGGSSANSGRPRSLDLSVLVAGGYERNNEEAEARRASSFEQTGGYEMFAGALAFSRRTSPRFELGATAGMNARYFNPETNLQMVSQYAGIGFNAAPAGRITATGNQGMNCGPINLQGLRVPTDRLHIGESGEAGVDYFLGDLLACTLATNANVSMRAGERSTVAFMSDLSYTRFEESSGYDPLRSYAIGGTYSHRMSRNAGISLGYIRRVGQTFVGDGSNRETLVHDLALSTDYSRPLSRSRRASVDFGATSFVYKRPTELGTAEGREYRIGGNAGLNLDTGRTWHTRLVYNRGVAFLDGLSGAIKTDGVSVSVGGFLTRRVDLTISGSGTVGQVIRDQDTPDLSDYAGSARLRIGLARSWALSSEYSYYYSVIPPENAVLFPVPSQLTRQAFRIGVTTWTPLLNRR
jgi:hypothetical protein